MKRITTTAALAVVALLTLTGCAESASNAADERVAPASSETVEPLVAEEGEPSAAVEAGGNEGELAFLEAFREIQMTYASVIPDASDEQLLEAGYEACERLAAGEVSTDISLIEGEERNAQSLMYLDSVSIVGAAVPHLCP